MFTLSELASLSEHQASSKLLKPWWEVFMEYLVVLMLMVSVLSGTLLLSRDQVVCLPLDLPITQTNHSEGGPIHRPQPQAKPFPPPDSPWVPARGRRTHLDYQQYIYISQVCYHEALPWYSRFFPYVALLQSLVMMASGCFWFHFPLTSARIEHFLAILAKCCESPWTSRALSHAARQEEVEGDTGPQKFQTPPSPQASSASVPRNRQSSMDSGTDSPLLGRLDDMSTAAPPSPCPSMPFRSSSLSSVSPTRGCVLPSKPSGVLDSSQRVASLDRSDGEQARALFERVRRFRSHCENSDVIYKVYLAQTLFKLLLAVLIVSYTTPLMGSISLIHTCLPQAHALTGYSAFECTHALASVLHKLLLAYVSLVGLFGLLSLYALSWILHSCLRQYSFNKLRELGSMRDVPDLCNDLAFLLHMADQYDPLLAQRLSVFLSPVSETCLLEESLERRWGAERLHSMTTVDPEGRPLLQLVALPRLPPALFTLSQLVVLKLELITDAKLPAQVANMTSLRELHLYHCTAALEPGALMVLQERLEVLHLTFTQAAEIPGWVYSLRGLQELHLSGRMGCESGVGRSWALGSLRQLRHLRMLVLRGMLQRVPGELGEVAGSLVRLEIHNEGSRLLVLTGLRRVAGLTELRLQGCHLERIPSALLALTSLRTLDLQNNSLRTLEELLGLAHLRRLSCLRLAHNRILSLPASVGALRALELLDLGYNQLQSLPLALFNLHGLHRLLLAGNLLEELPAEIGALRSLTELDLSGNRLESLPPELFSHCLELRSLNVSHNSLGSLPPGLRNLCQLSRLDVRSNSLEDLPIELGCCSGLHGKGLLVEDWLLHSLPRHVREFLTQPGSPTSKSTASNSRPDSDSFPYFSTTQWSFSSAPESRI
ncbi:volume-regulated anion channel subunit LRRC8D [Esox lucius]|uniref:LRRC8 pannexin-like TM region domain-containing protein n=1 Tax=Esox lucius TaxID=8010 RepID=A0A3P8ZV46_ESOLU|nr:volume-regulated anion channel subunit LRRC8D [Esox lucius]XP_010899338.2 volume-regulated anion channel subunit LRRC8D [Esox lucius]XP_010899339.2 volume-regulated anion channel subunit LRRC8D [Esox lucius]